MTNNPNYTPVDWDPKPDRPLYSDEVYHGDKLCVAPLGEYCDDPIHGDGTGLIAADFGATEALAAMKDSGISAADVQPVTISGYEPPESLEYFDAPEPEIPTLAELEGTPVLLDGKVVGRVGKMQPANDFEFRDLTIAGVTLSTLNSLGEKVRVGDVVSHLAIKDDRGTVEEIGSALIANTDVPNAVKVRWPSPASIAKNDIVSWHHVDNLTIINCTCTHDHCDGRPGETDGCYPCLILDPEAPCLADDGGEA